MKKKLVTLITATSLIFGLVGCHSKKADQNSYSAISIKELNKGDNKLDNKQEIYQKYYDYFKKYNIEYEYDSLYISDEKIDQMIKTSKDTSECTNDASAYLVDNKYDTALIIQKIKENTNKYVKDNKKFSSAFFGEETTKNKILEGCKLRFEVTLDICIEKILENATNNIEEDLCNLIDLKCVMTDNATYNNYDQDSTIDNYGIYKSEENLIIINSEALINLYNQTDAAEFNNSITTTIYCLINYMRQRNCDCRVDETKKYYPLNYQDITENTTLYKSSAESSYYNEFGITNQNKKIFSKEQEDEMLLFLLSIFSNNDITDYYNSIYDGDLTSLHKFFGLDTQEEIYEFYKIIYSIDGKNGNNNLSNKIEEDNKQIGDSYKENILKLVLEDMINYTYNNKDFNIEENISLLSLVNYIINNYNQTKDNSELADKIYSLNSEYIAFLQQYYNIDEKEMNYYLSDNFINKIITEVENLPHKTTSVEKNLILPKLLQRFPNLKYVLNTELDNGMNMNDLLKIKTK